jgi:hypothetical protein
MVDSNGKVDVAEFLNFLSALFKFDGPQSSTESSSMNECKHKMVDSWTGGALTYLRNEYGRNKFNIENCNINFEIAARSLCVLNSTFSFDKAANHLLVILWIAFEASIDLIDPSSYAIDKITHECFSAFSNEKASAGLEHFFSVADQNKLEDGIEPMKKRIKLRIGYSRSANSGGINSVTKSFTEAPKESQTEVDLECAVARWAFILMINFRMRTRGIPVPQLDLPQTLLSALQSSNDAKRSKRLRYISDLRSWCMYVLQAVSCGDRWEELISTSTKISSLNRNFDVDFCSYAIEDFISEVVIKNEDALSAVLNLLDSLTFLDHGATIIYRSMIGKHGLRSIDSIIKYANVNGPLASRLFLCSTISRLNSDSIGSIEKSSLVRSGFAAFIGIISNYATDSAFLSFVSSTCRDKIAEESVPIVAIYEIIRILKFCHYNDVRSMVISFVEKIRSTALRQVGGEDEVCAVYIAMICIVQVFQGEIAKDVDDFCYSALEGMNNRGKITRTLALELLRLIAPVLPASKHNSSTLPLHSLEILSSGTSLLHGIIASTSTDMSPKSSVTHARGRALRSYQWHGVRWITQLWRYGFGGGILSDEMGLGKSIQAIAAVLVRKLENPDIMLPHLVICPSSLTNHWMREIEAAVSSDMLKSSLLKDFLNHKGLCERICDLVVVATYDEVRRNIVEINKLWKFDVVILDEAHLIRNPETALAQAVFSLSSNRRLALTGTPIQNQVYLFRFLLLFRYEGRSLIF